MNAGHRLDVGNVASADYLRKMPLAIEILTAIKEDVSEIELNVFQ